MPKDECHYAPRLCIRTLAIIFIALSFFPVISFAETLNSKMSEVFFVSVKKGMFAERHHFKNISGHIDDSGKVFISIDLSSVNTNISIRNKRIKKYLFDVSRFPNAEIHAKVDRKMLLKLEAGQQKLLSLRIKLQLHGVSQKLDVLVRVTRLADQSLVVHSRAPVLLNVSDYDLAEGVDKLRELAGLPSISPIVPVTFSLTFNDM